MITKYLRQNVDDMDNVLLLKTCFDGHYVVVLRRESGNNTRDLSGLE